MLKKLPLIALCSLVFTFFYSCTGDVGSLEAGPVASYTFSSSGPVIAGIYAIGRQMDPTNTVTFQINVTVRGKYTVRTASQNGVYFEASGIFTATGPQSLVLYGKGIPVKAGSFSYSAGAGGTSNFSISFLANTPAGTFTYPGAPGSCSAPVIGGTYGSGVALGAANYVDLTIDVTSLGTYSITTNNTNGIFFSASGNFSTIGTQQIRLMGNGTPVSSGSFSYTASGGGCPFNINVTNGGGTSVYTLDCASPVIAGTYLVGLPLSVGNTVTIKANVTVAGTYTITTGAVNGMTFSATGAFGVGAGQNVVLTGSGAPLAANTSNFTISGGCPFSITATTPPPAVYTLTCNGTSVTGSYTVGSVLTASNKVNVEVNVTTVGGYTITSNTINGMTFAKTGVFTSTGIQTVTLTGSGTPAAAGTSSFTVGAASCPFDVTVTAPTSPCTGLTTDKFTIIGQYSLTGASIGFDIGTGYQVSIQQGLVQVEVTFPGNTAPAPGTYSVGTVKIHSLAADFRDWNGISGTIYVSSNGFNTTIEFCNVNIRGTSFVPGGGTIDAICEGKMVL